MMAERLVNNQERRGGAVISWSKLEEYREEQERKRNKYASVMATASLGASLAFGPETSFLIGVLSLTGEEIAENRQEETQKAA